MPTTPQVLILTGPPGAGKTSAARLLSQRFGPGVHLADTLARRLVAGELTL